MKIAVLSDIHGNLRALEAAARDASEQGADRVIVAGDLVNRGPRSVEVLQYVADCGWPAVVGNHDQLVADWCRGAVPPADAADPWFTPLRWVAERVAPWMDYLASLPFHVTVEVPGGTPLRIVHASPRDTREGIRPSTTEAELAAMLAGVRERLVVCGHTHVPVEISADGRRAVNVGSVGAPFNGDPRAQYGLLASQPDGSWRTEVRAVEYDHAAAIADFAATGYLDAGTAAHVFQHELAVARCHLYRFERWAKREGRPKDTASWLAYARSDARSDVRRS